MTTAGPLHSFNLTQRTTAPFFATLYCIPKSRPSWNLLYNSHAKNSFVIRAVFCSDFVCVQALHSRGLAGLLPHIHALREVVPDFLHDRRLPLPAMHVRRFAGGPEPPGRVRRPVPLLADLLGRLRRVLPRRGRPHAPFAVCPVLLVPSVHVRLLPVRPVALQRFSVFLPRSLGSDVPQALLSMTRAKFER